MKNSERVSLLEQILGNLSRNNNKKLLSKLAEQEIHYLGFKQGHYPNWQQEAVS